MPVVARTVGLGLGLSGGRHGRLIAEVAGSGGPAPDGLVDKVGLRMLYRINASG